MTAALAKGAWKRVRGGTIAYVHSSGAFIEKVRTDRYRAVRSDGEVVRVALNADGTPYTPRPWHTGADKPVVHYFSTVASAQRAALALPTPETRNA